MKNYTFVHEKPEHFLLHNGVAHFKVSKAGISEPTADKIRALAKGGKVDPTVVADQANYDAALRANPPGGGYPNPAKKADPSTADVGLDERNREQQEDSLGKTYGRDMHLAEGGKLTAHARAEIPQKNFALPNGRYPIEDASHARNALARVSGNGSSAEKAEVRAKVHAKYPGIEQKMDDGGTVAPIDPDKAQSVSDSFKGALGFWNGGPTPSPSPVPIDPDAAQSVSNSFNAATHNNIPKKAMGGNITDPSQVHSTANESQSEAIRRYADGNPATLAKGGNVHHSEGKYHFHFYDGAVVPSPLDRESTGDLSQKSSPLDNYINAAEGVKVPVQGENTPVNASKLESQYGPEEDAALAPTDSEKLDSVAQEVNASPPADATSQFLPNPGAAPSPTPIPSSSSASPDSSQSVSPDQQISAAPKASAPMPGQNPDMLSDFDKNLAMEKSGIENSAAAQQKGYQQTVSDIKDNLFDQKLRNDAYNAESARLTAANQELFNNVAKSKVDPNQFWNNKSTGSKISSVLGVILGGIGAGLTGGPNLGLATLQNHIQQDIEAQKLDQSNRVNLYKMGLERFKDAQSAQQFATLQSNALLQGQIQKTAAMTGSAQVMANAQQMIGQLGVQNAGIRQSLALSQAALSSMNQPQQQSGIDNNKLRLLIAAGVIPKEEVPTAMKEYGDYGKLNSVLDHTDQVFKGLTQNSNYRERISNAIPFGSHIPTVTDSSKQYEALANDWLGNITKDTEGRVTPTDVDLMRPSLPQVGDSPQVAQTKINNIKDQIREKYDFPTLKTNKLLSPNDPIATSSATRAKRFNESAPK